MTYTIRDNRTGLTNGTYQNRKRAQSKADRMNLDYGAHRYSVQLVA